MADEEVPELIEVTEPATRTAPGKPVPVTLITGFLGAGKTSLVRHILSAPHGLRIAVILNEFGEGVESAYFQDLQGLRDSSGEWVELDNGCMCCATKSDFVLALEALMAKERRPDYILIETTGMANPGPVAAALWTDEQLEAGVQLDSIITVVDAINIDRQLHAKRADNTVNEAQVQIAYADLILLNKMDLCEEEAVARAEADIRAINSTVHIIRTTSCTVDLNVLLNRQGYKLGSEDLLAPIAEVDGDEGEGGDSSGPGISSLCLDPSATASGPDLTVFGTRMSLPSAPASVDEGRQGGAASPSGSRAASLARGSMGASGGHSRGVSLSLDPLASEDSAHAKHGKPHDPEVQTVCLSTDQPLELDRVKAFLDKLLWDREAHSEDIYRVKGVLCIHGQEAKHMVQAVYELYNIAPSARWMEGERRQSRIVVIGRTLNKPLLEQWFQSLAVRQA